jgi:phage terminase large subunit GpA-like protein
MWVSAALVTNSHSVDTGLVNGLVKSKNVDKIRTEGVFRRKANFNAGTKSWVSARGSDVEEAHSIPLDIFNDFKSSLLDQLHALSMAVLSQKVAGTDN